METPTQPSHPDADAPAPAEQPVRLPLIPRSAEDITKKYFSIGEVADLLEVNQSVLRFWETEFDQLRPRKTRKGRRLYTRQDVELLKSIHYLVKVRKYTLQGAREKLSTQSNNLSIKMELRDRLLEVRKNLEALRELL